MIRKKNLRFLLFCAAFFLSTGSLASFYCADTNRMVNEGDLMETVRSACGQPTSVVIKEETIDVPTQVTQWVYMPYRPADPTKTQDYLARLIVIFNDQGRVIKLRQSEIQDALGHPDEPNAVFCNVDSIIKIGDDIAAVEFGCGKPTFINKLQSAQDVTKEVVEWQYQKNNLAPVVFRFEEGVLKERLKAENPSR